MRTTSVLLLALAVSMTARAADSLEGKTIVLKANEQTSRNVPVAVPYDGDVPEGRIVVEHPKTGNEFPATLRNGELVFVPDGAMPGTQQEYVVNVESEAKPPQVRIEKQEGKDALDVYILDKHFVTYNYGKEYKKPFLWPVNGVGGVHVTRDWPMVEPGVEKSNDHVHQKSIWSAHGDLNGVDFWGEGEGSGSEVTNDVTYGSGDGYGWIHAKDTWVDKDGKPVISEEREYRFYATPEGGRLFDESITFTTDHGAVKWGDTKEGGIFALRIRPSMEERHGGAILTSTGARGEEEAWGKPANWCDYSGNPDGSGIQGITVMDHPDNFRHPANWHVRKYGLMGANYFGYSYFYEGENKNGDYNMDANQTLTFNYRCYVHKGGAEEANVADYWADYANPPAASWQE